MAVCSSENRRCARCWLLAALTASERTTAWAIGIEIAYDWAESPSPDAEVCNLRIYENLEEGSNCNVILADNPGETSETNTITFSQEMTGVQFALLVVNSSEPLTLVLDGQTLDMQTALNGAVISIATAGATGYTIRGGRLSGTMANSTWDDNVILAVNEPATSIGFGSENSGATADIVIQTAV